ncbi:MAG: RNA-guided endonuclease InsQ/TnpB family protein [Halanaerobiaceae bacterium]
MNKTYKIPVLQYDLARKLCRQSGRIYSKVVSTIFNVQSRKGFWLQEGDMKKLIKLYASDIGLHSQSKQGVVEQYYTALDSYFKALENHNNPKPPYKTYKFNKVVYKKSAIKSKDSYLRVSNGRSEKPLIVDIPDISKCPKYAELIYNNVKDKYFLHIVVEIENKQRDYANNDTLAIDIGQIHPMVTFDGEQSKVYNGGKLNSFIRFRNKELGKLQKKMSRCEKYSRRWKRLNSAKHKLLDKSIAKIDDVLQKYTSHLIGYCIKQKISTIVIGDIKGIRKNIDYDSKNNQNLHGWMFKKLTDIIEYKAKSVSIKVEYIDESYTSQTCPKCGNRYKSSNRNYKCSKCGFEYHRDSVGAVNIYRKYTSSTSFEDKPARLEGELIPPVGIRYNSNQCYLADWNTSIFNDAGYSSNNAKEAA